MCLNNHRHRHCHTARRAYSTADGESAWRMCSSERSLNMAENNIFKKNGEPAGGAGRGMECKIKWSVTLDRNRVLLQWSLPTIYVWLHFIFCSSILFCSTQTREPSGGLRHIGDVCWQQSFASTAVSMQGAYGSRVHRKASHSLPAQPMAAADIFFVFFSFASVSICKNAIKRMAHNVPIAGEYSCNNWRLTIKLCVKNNHRCSRHSRLIVSMVKFSGGQSPGDMRVYVYATCLC